MYHWQKNTGQATRFSYRGLTFPVWMGFLSNDEIKSKKTFYAFYGGIKLTEAAIRYQVDRLIADGLYLPEAA